MYKIFALFLFITFFILLPPLHDNAQGKTLRFAVVPKDGDSSFYLSVKAGCMDAAESLQDVQCIFIGPDKANPRLQDNVIADVIDKGIDGLAVAVINSKFIETRSIAKAREAGIPIVTFDSDFSTTTLSETPGVRSAYIGTDNYRFGRKLGELASSYRPKGGTYCIISGHKSAPGLVNRMRGAQDALTRFSQAKWKQHDRCPLFSRDDPKLALSQLVYLIDSANQGADNPDTIIVLGAWPQQARQEYIDNLRARKNSLDSKKVVVIIGDAMLFQLEMLKQGLAHGNVGQQPYEMGKKTIETLYKIHHGQSVPEIIYTPVKSYGSGN